MEGTISKKKNKKMGKSEFRKKKSLKSGGVADEWVPTQNFTGVECND